MKSFLFQRRYQYLISVVKGEEKLKIKTSHILLPVLLSLFWSSKWLKEGIRSPNIFVGLWGLFVKDYSKREWIVNIFCCPVKTFCFQWLNIFVAPEDTFCSWKCRKNCKGSNLNYFQFGGNLPKCFSNKTENLSCCNSSFTVYLLRHSSIPLGWWDPK